ISPVKCHQLHLDNEEHVPTVFPQFRDSHAIIGAVTRAGVALLTDPIQRQAVGESPEGKIERLASIEDGFHDCQEREKPGPTLSTFSGNRFGYTFRQMQRFQFSAQKLSNLSNRFRLQHLQMATSNSKSF